jgi:TRAP-type C4-dicarboxylate transport system substrate-binding protein
MTFRFAFVLVAAAALSSPAAAQTRWDMPTPYAESNFQTKNIIQFVRDVENATKGSLRITVYAGGSLIKHAEIKRAVRRGRVPIGEMLVSLAADESPIYGLDTVPFLATNYDQARKLYAAQRPYLEKKLAQDGLMLLFSVPWPPQGIYAKKEITRLSDLKGLKFRAQNAMARRMATIAGAIPTPIETPDLASAIATGKVDAVVTSVTTDVDLPALDQLGHYHNVNLWLPRNMVFVNKSRFDALAPAQKTALLDAAKTAEERGWKASELEAAQRTKILVDHNVTIVDPGQALKNDLNTLLSPVLVQEWRASAGPDGQAILNEFGK